MTAINIPLRAGRTPAAAPASDPTWQNIDPASLPEDLQRHYYAYKQALDAANKARALFESECNEAFDVGAGNRLAFGYKFGRLSVAIVRDAPRTPKGLASIASLARPR
jgi:hypothetical protein